jgi:hypothetical protein
VSLLTPAATKAGFLVRPRRSPRQLKPGDHEDVFGEHDANAPADKCFATSLRTLLRFRMVPLGSRKPFSSGSCQTVEAELRMRQSQ